ncbi:hypothetical protein BJX66DRAFT_61228 [Aspergillus keveii]|uniref:Uncharacterized protein n=1 Tax=Aspergillus keveii TaxID=714993 RepID=A0ABR4FPV5_9EURO
MFLCARPVEQSIKERKFHRKSEPQGGGRALQLHWLQPGNQAVGDQVFDAFAYNDLKNPLTQYVFSSNDKDPKSAFLVWIAIVITMGGFVLQFVGLRALHSSVAVFQLGAMLVMSFIRAALRTRRFDTNENLVGEMLDLVQGHELDWQALEFEASEKPSKDSDRVWLVRNSPVELQQGTATGSRFEG